MKRISFILISFLVILTCLNLSNAHAQWTNQQELSEKMRLHNLAILAPTLFVHFDKTIYTNSETAWFTGYLLNADQNVIEKHRVLSVALVRDLDTLIIKQEKFLINNGISFGNMVLPDSILPGNYHFQVTTNMVKNGLPDVAFIQSILIKTNLETSFNASIKLIQSDKNGANANQALITVASRGSQMLTKPVEVNYKYGNIDKTSMTNVLGELTLDLPNQINSPDQNLYAKVKYGTEVSFLSIPVPLTIKKASVNFYPEGGNIIAGIPIKITWEVKDNSNATVALKATLFKNKIAIDTIETNSYGIGHFILKPDQNSTYTVRLIHSAFVDSNYYLPPIKNNGIVLTVKDSTPQDTLVVKIVGSKAQKVALRLHDFSSTFFYNECHVDILGKTLKIPVENLSKGLKAITVFDSLGKPLAERLVFTQFETIKNVAIKTDAPTYGQRQKITLHLKLTGKDTLGLVSIACVQDNRILSSSNYDIKTYVYLRNELSGLLPVIDGLPLENKEYIEDMLLTKGWRRYTWTDILKTTADDTLRPFDPQITKVEVLKGNNPIEKVIQLAVFGEKRAKIYSTNEKGQVEINDEDLVVPYGKKVQLAAVGKGQRNLKIRSIDPYVQLNKSYLKLHSFERLSSPSLIQNSMELMLKNDEKMIQLREVNITSKKENDLNYEKGRNECGDYLCGNKHLNCPGLSPEYYLKPKIGETYHVLFGPDIYYTGCKKDEFMTPVPGIYTKKEFYVNDFKDSSEQAFVSTIYWNHGTLINSKDQEISFYTSDITGKYRIVLQGITDKGLLYEQCSFEVKAKN